MIMMRREILLKTHSSVKRVKPLFKIIGTFCNELQRHVDWVGLIFLFLGIIMM